VKKSKDNKIDPTISEKYDLPLYTKIMTPRKAQGFCPDSVGHIANFELSEERFTFDTDPNPHSALAVFVKCVEFGYYPPPEILHYISDRFKLYMQNDISLDDSMRVTKNKKNYYYNRHRNIYLIIEIDTLRHYFNISHDDAVTAVCRRYEVNGVELSGTTITDIYYRNGKKEMDKSLKYLHDDIELLNEMSGEYSENKKLELLKQYPQDIIDLITNMTTPSTRMKR